jgi:hypothetical protein
MSLDPLDVIGLACTLPALTPDIIESDDENNLINTIMFNVTVYPPGSFCLQMSHDEAEPIGNQVRLSSSDYTSVPDSLRLEKVAILFLLAMVSS